MNEKQYISLINKGFSPQDINQIEKTMEAGYDIYNPDIWMSSDKIREFRSFLIKNLKPVFTHDQLREIQIGFLKNLNVLEYANEKYNEKEMLLLRKYLESGKDCEILKKYSKNEKEMQIVYNALLAGLEQKDFEQYDIKQIEYITNAFRAKEEDPRYLFDDGYNIEQAKIIRFHKILRPSVDLEKYVNKNYGTKEIEKYGDLLRKNKQNLSSSKLKEDTLKIVFNEKFNEKQINFFITLISKGQFSLEYVNPNYCVDKMELINTMRNKKCSEKNIEDVKKSDLPDKRYEIINNYIKHSSFDYALIDDKIEHDTMFALSRETNIDLFKDLAYKGFNFAQIRIILKNYEKGINLNEYANINDNINNLCFKGTLLEYCKQKKLSIKETDEILRNIKSKDELNHYEDCKKFNLNYKEYSVELSTSELKKIATFKKDGIDLSKFDLENMSLTKIDALGNALKLKLPIENILLNTKDYKFHAILTAEKFNSKNERKINISDILKIDTTPKELGIIISKLISDKLEDNIEGYKMLETNKKIEKHKEINER